MGKIKFKAAKSRSLFIKNGQTTESFKLEVQNVETAYIAKSPRKCLGKRFDACLQDRDNVWKPGRLEEGQPFRTTGQVQGLGCKPYSLMP